MKKPVVLILLMLVMVPFFSGAQSEARIKAQQQWIKTHAAFFVGKPFSQFYDSLKIIRPVSIWGWRGHANRFVEYGHTFYYMDTAAFDPDNYHFHIDWQEPIPLAETKKYQNFGVRAFNTQEYPTYANRIIRKIVVYNPDDLPLD